MQVLTLAVDMHGQLLLLVHWSILAYTGLVKILKKHHKRTGFPIRAPHLENLLSQPFCSVEVVNHLSLLTAESLPCWWQGAGSVCAVYAPLESSTVPRAVNCYSLSFFWFVRISPAF